jgi:hypothetical protein
VFVGILLRPSPPVITPSITDQKCALLGFTVFHPFNVLPSKRDLVSDFVCANKEFTPIINRIKRKLIFVCEQVNFIRIN